MLLLAVSLGGKDNDYEGADHFFFPSQICF
jgi:hypothetical protein